MKEHVDMQNNSVCQYCLSVCNDFLWTGMRPRDMCNELGEALFGLVKEVKKNNPHGNWGMLLSRLILTTGYG